jgi:hypothetical protein
LERLFEELKGHLAASFSSIKGLLLKIVQKRTRFSSKTQFFNPFCVL